MSGKIRLNSTSTANCGAGHLRENKAFEEGMQYRLQGASATYAKANNPHDGLGDEAETAWDAGWDLVHASAGSPFTAAEYGSAATSGGANVAA